MANEWVICYKSLNMPPFMVSQPCVGQSVREKDMIVRGAEKLKSKNKREDKYLDLRLESAALVNICLT